MRRARQDSQAGSMAVEAAFTLTTLIIFLLGIMEAGRFFQVQQFLTDAAHEGARVAVKPQTKTSTLAAKSQIDDAVQQFLAAGGINVTSGNIAVDCVNLADGSNLTAGSTCTFGCPANTPCGTRVTVSSSYQVVTLAMFSNLHINLAGKALMRNETSP